MLGTKDKPHTHKQTKNLQNMKNKINTQTNQQAGLRG